LKRKYKFTNKSQSKMGIISSILGCISMLLTAGAFVLAYIQKGQAGKIIAMMGFLALLLSLVGLYYGFGGTKEEDTYGLFPHLGCAVNIIVLAVVVFIYIVGW